MILPRHLFASVRSWCPVLLEQSFGHADEKSKDLWLDKLAVALGDSMLHDYYMHSIDDLRRVIRMESPEHKNSSPNITQMIADIHAVANGHGPTPNMICHHELPRDNEVQLFPGGDHLEMPADALVEMNQPWETKMEDILCMGSMVVCKPMGAQVAAMSLPFLLGMLIGPSADEASECE